MLHLKDIILLLVVFLSMGAGLVWPEPSGRLSPYLNLLLMILLYLAFLKVRPQAIQGELQQHPKEFLFLVVLKLFLLPALIYPLAACFKPEYALGLLLLAGVSTGVSAPFFAAMVGAHIPLVLLLTVATSMLLPATLPFMARVLAGQNLAVDPVHLGGLIGAIIFIPLIGASLTQRILPRLAQWLGLRTYYPSLLLIAVINLGAFGNFAPFLKAHQSQIVLALGLSTVLALILSGIGAAAFWRCRPPVQAAAAASLGWINNILVLVLGNDLGDPYVSLLAALYLIPFHLLILPLGHLSRRQEIKSAKHPMAPSSMESL
jgi:BASS family bile acid:Na+ symporter